MKLDTISQIETPEGVDLSAEVVGLTPRALAYLIDFLIRIGLYFALAIALSFFGVVGYGLLLIIWFALEWWYPVLFEYFRDGQTIGKKSMGIKVVNDDFTRLTFAAALTRNLLRAADFLPLFYGFGALSMMVSNRFQRLGDFAAGTVVIYAEPSGNTNHALSKITAIAPSQTLSDEQQAACINFTLNRGNISAARLEELAEIIRPILPSNTVDPVAYIKGVGKWLMGATSEAPADDGSLDRSLEKESAASLDSGGGK